MSSFGTSPCTLTVVPTPNRFFHSVLRLSSNRCWHSGEPWSYLRLLPVSCLRLLPFTPSSMTTRSAMGTATSSAFFGSQLFGDPCYFECDPVTSKELDESFPTVPRASANSHAFHVLTFRVWHWLTPTVARASDDISLDPQKIFGADFQATIAL